MVLLLFGGIVFIGGGLGGALYCVYRALNPPAPKPAKLTKSEQQKLIADMDEWRESAVDRLTTTDQLEAITNFYEVRRALIEQGTNPGPIRKDILALLGG